LFVPVVRPTERNALREARDRPSPDETEMRALIILRPDSKWRATYL
jgi:hypothetical protein